MRILSCQISCKHRRICECSDKYEFILLTCTRFQLLAVPLLGREIDVRATMKASESLMSFLSYSHLPKGSEDRRVTDLIRQCFTAACNIYSRCAFNADARPIFHNAVQMHAIQQLISVMTDIAPDARGAHALVWVCFIAGAASTDQSQRDFFVHRMVQVYMRTRFRNIPIAIQSLQKIWTRGHGDCWTLCLAQLSNGLAM